MDRRILGKCDRNFSQDVSATVAFIQTECTDEALYFLAEISEGIARKTQSGALISALRSRLKKVAPETYDQNSFSCPYMRDAVDYQEYVRSVSMDIDFAEGAIENR